MNIIKKIFFVGMVAFLPFSLGLCYHGPKVAVGWVGHVSICNPLTGQELLRHSLPVCVEGGVPHVPEYLIFLPSNINQLFCGIKKYQPQQYCSISSALSRTKTQMLGGAHLIVKNKDCFNVIVADRSGKIKSYDDLSKKSLKPVFDFSGHQGVVCLTLYSQSGELFLVAGTSSGFIDIYNYKTGKLIRSINCYESGIYEGAWINTVLAFQDGKSIKIVASTSIAHGQIGCWDVASGETIYVVDCFDEVDHEQPNSGDVYNLNLYKDIDGSLKLVASAQDPARVIKIWDPLTGTVLQILYNERFNNTYPLPIRVFRGNDESGEVIKLIVGYYNGKLAVWNTRTGLVEAVVEQNGDLPRGFSRMIRFITLFEVNGQNYCTVGNDDGSIYTWTLETLQPVVNWSVSPGNLVSAITSSQEFCIDPTQFQLGFFSAQSGCHVPFFDVENEININADLQEKTGTIPWSCKLI